jgi:hypothetical protein
LSQYSILHFHSLQPALIIHSGYIDAEISSNNPMEARLTRGRISTLLVANATWSGKERVVRIRDMSAFGALIQSEELPHIGEDLTIAREGNTALGKVIWVREKAFGVKFHSPVDSLAWFGEETNQNAEADIAQLDDDPQKLRIIQRRLAEELDFVSRIADAVSNILVEDPVFRRRHATPLQELSIATQMLSEISNIMISDLSIASVEKHATGSMRNRILR